MPTFKELRAFLASKYKAERFKGRGEDYADAVTQSRLETLRERGTDLISRHESITGKAIRYNADLVVTS